MILLFGATGMVGQAIAAEAGRRRFALVGAARRDAHQAVDLARPAGVAALLDALRPAIVVNAAAIASIEACERNPDEAARVNAQVVAVMGAYCRVAVVPLVHISTDHFFTGDGPRAHDEREPVRLVNHYARTKYAAEGMALAAPGALVLRTNVTGLRHWRERPTFAEWAIEALIDRAPIRLFDDYWCSTIDAPSLARALFDLVEKGASGVINVGARTVATKRQFVRGIARALGVRLDWDEGASVRTLGVPRAESAGLDVSKAERLLGYTLPDTEAVCRNLVAKWEEERCAIPLAS
jgi:dTDP-4-dehydrorhamnose reductase